VEFYAEGLDAMRMPGRASKVEFVTLLKKRCALKSLDLIVLHGPMQEFFKHQRATLWPQTPYMFAGVPLSRVLAPGFPAGISRRCRHRKCEATPTRASRVRRASTNAIVPPRSPVFSPSCRKARRAHQFLVGGPGICRQSATRRSRANSLQLFRANAEYGLGHSFWVPAIEIPSFQLLLNRFDHYVVDADTYPGPWTNLHTNLHRSWVIDNDKFSTNQFLHPYQGSIYQGLARSAGLDSHHIEVHA
jgi:hypothetical protein